MKIEIEHLYDDNDCDTCGASWAEGARVYFDGCLVIELIPVAHCFGGSNWDTVEIYQMIFEKLGHTFTVKEE